MDLYNEQDQAIQIPYLENFFHEILPKKEVVYCIFQHAFLFNRDGLVIELSLLNCERQAYTSISRDNKIIVEILYGEADYLKIMDEKNKIFLIYSEWGIYNPTESTTILSLHNSPILQFFDTGKKRIMEVTPTDLMILFDDFGEKVCEDSNQKYFYFVCNRLSEKAELTIFPGTGKLSLIIISNGMNLCSVNLLNCDNIKIDLKEKKIVFTSGFDEKDYFIKCSLELNDSIVFHIYPNYRLHQIGF